MNLGDDVGKSVRPGCENKIANSPLLYLVQCRSSFGRIFAWYTASFVTWEYLIAADGVLKVKRHLVYIDFLSPKLGGLRNAKAFLIHAENKAPN